MISRRRSRRAGPACANTSPAAAAAAAVAVVAAVVEQSLMRLLSLLRAGRWDSSVWAVSRRGWTETDSDGEDDGWQVWPAAASAAGIHVHRTAAASAAARNVRLPSSAAAAGDDGHASSAARAAFRAQCHAPQCLASALWSCRLVFTAARLGSEERLTRWRTGSRWTARRTTWIRSVSLLLLPSSPLPPSAGSASDALACESPSSLCLPSHAPARAIRPKQATGGLFLSLPLFRSSR